MSRYIRDILGAVEGYVPGEQPTSTRVVKLNTNENPYPPSPKVIEALRNIEPNQLRRYPDPVSAQFRDACAKQFGYADASWAIVGNGMDELLALAVRTYVDPGDTILTTYPTYTLYETLAQLHGANIVTVDLDESWQLPESFFDTPARLCFLPRPNAPTGVCANMDAMHRLCERFPGIVVIDEAYVDFAGDHCMEFPAKYSNVLVMRSFSKSFSLAGMRLGMAIGQPPLIEDFLKTKDSYNLNAVAQAVGKAAMADYAYMRENVAKVCATRARLTDALDALGFRMPPSQANFVLAFRDNEPSAREIFETLREQGIFVRYFNARRIDSALRISVGTDEEIDALIDALHGIIG